MTAKGTCWSFGVTAWEVLSLCRRRPLSALSDAEVIRNAERIYFGEGNHVSSFHSGFCVTRRRKVVIAIKFLYHECVFFVSRETESAKYEKENPSR